MRLLLDENVEKALFLGLKRRHPGLDVVRVVDVGLGGRSDAEVLEWAAREGRVLVSRDHATLSAEAARRIEEGRPMSGLILLRRGVGVGRILGVEGPQAPGGLRDLPGRGDLPRGGGSLRRSPRVGDGAAMEGVSARPRVSRPGSIRPCYPCW